MPIKPAGADQRLVESFQRAVEGRGDGRVSETDVREQILPRLRDGGGRLSEREKETLAWAVSEFKLTDAAKRALSDEITRLAGAPVFAWQRELGGVIAVQLDGALPQPQLDRKAGEALLLNAENQGADWRTDSSMYWYPEAGNSGSHLSEHTGARADEYLRFMAAVLNKPELRDQFSASTHAVYGVYQSGDEEHFGAILVDKKTGKATALDTYNIVDLTYDLDRPTFESIFGEVKGSDGRRAPDDEWQDAIWNGDFMNDHLHGDRSVDIPRFSKAQRERRSDALGDASRELYETLRAGSATSGRKAVLNTGVLTRSDDVAAVLENLAREVHEVDYRDKEKPGASATVVSALRPFDAAARDAIHATARAVNADVSAAGLDRLIAGLGSASDLEHAVLELPMTVKDSGGAELDVTSRVHLLVNKVEGDWLGVYERQKVAGDW